MEYLVIQEMTSLILALSLFSRMNFGSTLELLESILLPIIQLVWFLFPCKIATSNIAILRSTMNTTTQFLLKKEKAPYRI